MNKQPTPLDALSSSQMLWEGLSLWQQCIVGGLLFIVLVVPTYMHFFTDKEVFTEKEENVLGMETIDFKLAGISFVLFLVFVVGGGFLYAKLA